MATRITNQDTLTYQYAGTTGQAASNIATALLQEALSVAKTTLDTNYRRNGELTYIRVRQRGVPASLILIKKLFLLMSWLLISS